MTEQLIWLLLFLALLGSLILSAEVLHKKFHYPSEQSRKFLHVSGGLLSLLLPLFFKSHWWVLALCAIAFIILLVTYKKNLLSSVHQVNRYTLGSVIFPIPVYLCFLVAELKHMDIYFFLPISLLTISDTAAEMGGQKCGERGPKFFNNQKTLVGSLFFFATAIIVSFCWLHFKGGIPFLLAMVYGILIAITTCIAELVTLHGWDNLSVPAATLLLLLII